MQSLANTRKTGKEQYYTKPSIAKMCMDIAKKYVGDDVLLEPCAGTGEFFKLFPPNESYAFDIEPKGDNIQKQNFLELLSFKPDNFSVITNPPFGRANSLSARFFNHASDLGAKYICFLIPISWRKWSLQDRLDRNYHLVEDVELPNDHLFYGDDVDESKQNVLKCVFQVWERRKELRPLHKEQITDKGLLTATKPDTADVAIIQQGWKCGKVVRDFDRNKNVNGWNYYYADEATIVRLEQLYDEDAYAEFKKNSAYVASLSLLEINSVI